MSVNPCEVYFVTSYGITEAQRLPKKHVSWNVNMMLTAEKHKRHSVGEAFEPEVFPKSRNHKSALHFVDGSLQKRLFVKAQACFLVRRAAEMQPALRKGPAGAAPPPLQTTAKFRQCRV